MNSRNDLLTISDFANLSGISRRTLIFYDNIGLFSPIHVGENGYRYYTHKQIDTVSIIVTLKELGMSINHIKSYLTDQDPEKAIALFENQNQFITQRIDKLQNIQEMIKTRLSLMKKGIAVCAGTIELVTQKDIPAFISPPILKRKRGIPDDVWLHFYKECISKNIPFGYPVGFIVDQNSVKTDNTDVVSNIFFRMSSTKHSTGVIPAGKYVVGYTYGDYENTHKMYQNLFDYIQRHQLCIIGNAYEEFLLDEAATPKWDEYLLQIAIHVK